MVYTYQDFEEATRAGNVPEFIVKAINRHLVSDLYRTACLADLYDRRMNATINDYVRLIFSMSGTPIEDFTASNNKIASNFFSRLNTQRCTYSLGNGMTFTHKEERVDENGAKTTVDITKEKLGVKWDTDVRNLAYKALIHGVSFGLWNLDRLYVFPVTEFVPLWDECDGTLKAGIRFWRLSPDKPMVVVLYELDGYTKYRSKNPNASGYTGTFEEVTPKRPYTVVVSKAPADVDGVVVGTDNYSSLPVVPLWGSRLKQSTLIGMRESIDSYDLIRSGFANDLTDCSQIYWLVENCGGMTESDLAKVRDRLRINHIAGVDTDSGGSIKPYTAEIPYEARKVYLDYIRSGIYEDFGGLDVHSVEAGSTNDHLEAAYQPMDENADDFEFQLIEFTQQILSLMGVDDTPVFKRNRISNQKEQTEMILEVAQYLDDETILQKLPFISPDEVQSILARRDAQEATRYNMTEEQDNGTKDTTEEGPEIAEPGGVAD